jgi:hypothetical protein
LREGFRQKSSGVESPQVNKMFFHNKPGRTWNG